VALNAATRQKMSLETGSQLAHCLLVNLQSSFGENKRSEDLGCE
jgi:hypothetical protein